MFLFLYKSIRMVLAAIRGSNSPAQVGMGVALGMLIGLIPKDSLLVWALGILVFGTTINLLATSISAFCFMWIGYLLDPVSHQVGSLILTQSSFQSTFLWLYEQPVIPWTRFNNTVVMGSLAIGMISFFPAYLVSSSVFRRVAPRFNNMMIRYWFYRFLMGKDKVAQLAGADE